MTRMGVHGGPVDEQAHLSQSIADILTTPLGSRVERREYGSLLPSMIDAPFNAAAKLRLFGATATALMRWEPRLQLTNITLTPGAVPGSFVLDLVGRRSDRHRAGELTRLTVPLRFRSP
ncbi:GPW/gp25 family protein [Xanthomonas sp. 60]